MPLRTCTACHVAKEATRSNFYAHRGCKGGIDSICRHCRNELTRVWKHKNRERLSAKRRADYAAKYGQRHRELEARRAALFPLLVQASNLMSGVRERSKALGFVRPPQLVSKQYFIDWLNRQPHCECCGVRFSIERRGGEWREDAPSIDRFDTRRGYELDNIALICWRCNNIKRNYVAADLRRVADWMDVWGNQTDKFTVAA